MKQGEIDIYNEVDNFVEENEGEVTNTEIARHFFELGRNNAINNACEWLKEQSCCGYIEDIDVNEFVEQFRKAMESGCSEFPNNCEEGGKNEQESTKGIRRADRNNHP